MRYVEFAAILSQNLIGCHTRTDFSDFIDVGEYDLERGVYVIEPQEIYAFFSLFGKLSQDANLQKLLLQECEKRQKAGHRLIFRVVEAENSFSWRKACAEMLRQSWLLNLAPTLGVGSGVGMQLLSIKRGDATNDIEYFKDEEKCNSLVNCALGLNDENCDSLCQELQSVLFQLLWTAAVLSRCGFGQTYDAATDMVDATRVYSLNQNDDAVDVAVFSTEDSLGKASGVFFVPVSNCFVQIDYEPEQQEFFAHNVYKCDEKEIKVFAPIGANEPFSNRRLNIDMIRQGNLLANVAATVYCLLFAEPCAHAGFESIRVSLEQISQSISTDDGDAYSAFFKSELATAYWRPFQEEDREATIELFRETNDFPVLQLPTGVSETFVVQSDNFRSDWCGFPNIDNNCFLNSALFALLCPMGYSNSFSNAVDHYVAVPEPTQNDFEFVRSITGQIDEKNDLERARNIIASFFSRALRRAFATSNYGDWDETQLYAANARISKDCTSLLPLLNLWSKAVRGNSFVQNEGEFQDVGECLLLLWDLLKFESTTAALVCVGEELRDVDFEKTGQHLTFEQAELRSAQNKNSPLCVRVHKPIEEPPVIRPIIDWEFYSNDQDTLPIQKLCDESNYDFKIFPAPKTYAQKQQEKNNPGTTVPVCTRFRIEKKVCLRTKQMRMCIIHIPRQNFMAPMRRNPIEIHDVLTVAGVKMQVSSLILWRTNHYTSLVYAADRNEWYHMNDLMCPGMRCEIFGSTLQEALEVVQRRSFIVTSIVCVRQQSSELDGETVESLIANELSKMALPNDDLCDKALVLRKEEKCFSSVAESVHSFTNKKVVALPDQFLMGKDDPTLDFFYENDWFSDAILCERNSRYAVVISPHRSALVDVSSVKQAAERAKHTQLCIARLKDPAVCVNDEIVNCYLAALQAQHLGMTPLQYIQAGQVSRLRFDWYDNANENPNFDCKVWHEDSFFMELLAVDANRITNRMFRKRDNRWFKWQKAQHLVIPLHEPQRHHWTLLCVSPQQQLIRYYDTFAADGTEKCKLVASLLNSMLPESVEWSFENVFSEPVQNDTVSCGIFILHFAKLIFIGMSESIALQTHSFSAAKLFEMKRDIAQKIEDCGNLHTL